MADTSLADALTLFTKVNVSMLKRIEQLEGKKTNKYVKEKEKDKPESVIEETQPTEIESFSKKALGDLQKVFQYKAVQEKKDPDRRQRLKSMADEDLFMTLFKGAAFLGAIVTLFEKLWSKLGISNTIDLLKSATNGLRVGIYKLLDGVTEGLTKFNNSISKSVEELAAKVSAKPTTPTTPTPSTPPKLKSPFGLGGKPILPSGIQALEEYKQTQATRERQAKYMAGRSAEEIAAARQVNESWQQIQNQKKTQEALAELAARKKPSMMERMKGAAGSAWDSIKGFGGEVAGKFDKGKLYLLEKIQPLTQGLMKVMKSGPMKFLTTILKVPGIADAVFGYVEMRQAINEFEQGKISDKQLRDRFSQAGFAAVGSAMGGLAGGAGGAAFLGSLGSIVPGVGTGIGGFLGAIGGTAAGTYVGDILGRIVASGVKNLSPETSQEMGEYLKSMFFLNSRVNEAAANRPGEEDYESIDDGIITKDGKIIVPHADDSLYAMKSGGPFEKFFAKNNKLLEKNADLIEKLSDTNDTHLSRHSELLKETNKLLVEMMDKLQQPTINKANVINNNFNDGMTLRSLQAII